MDKVVPNEEPIKANEIPISTSYENPVEKKIESPIVAKESETKEKKGKGKRGKSKTPTEVQLVSAPKTGDSQPAVVPIESKKPEIPQEKLKVVDVPIEKQNSAIKESRAVEILKVEPKVALGEPLVVAVPKEAQSVAAIPKVEQKIAPAVQQKKEQKSAQLVATPKVVPGVPQKGASKTTPKGAKEASKVAPVLQQKEAPIVAASKKEAQKVAAPQKDATQVAVVQKEETKVAEPQKEAPKIAAPQKEAPKIAESSKKKGKSKSKTKEHTPKNSVAAKESIPKEAEKVAPTEIVDKEKKGLPQVLAEKKPKTASTNNLAAPPVLEPSPKAKALEKEKSKKPKSRSSSITPQDTLNRKSTVKNESKPEGMQRKSTVKEEGKKPGRKTTVNKDSKVEKPKTADPLTDKPKSDTKTAPVADKSKKKSKSKTPKVADTKVVSMPVEAVKLAPQAEPNQFKTGDIQQNVEVKEEKNLEEPPKIEPKDFIKDEITPSKSILEPILSSEENVSEQQKELIGVEQLETIEPERASFAVPRPPKPPVYQPPEVDFSEIFHDWLGQKRGLFCFRIESFIPILQPEPGVFCVADCYILLNTTKEDGQYYNQVFTWIGGESTMDKMFCCAMYAVALRNQANASNKILRQVMITN